MTSSTLDTVAQVEAEARARLVAEVDAMYAETRSTTGLAAMSPAVRAALGKVERHRLVPPAQRSLAYRNHPLPIGHGQTLSQPTVVALMSQAIAPTPMSPSPHAVPVLEPDELATLQEGITVPTDRLLAIALRELAITRTGILCNAPYEVAAHKKIGAGVGVLALTGLAGSSIGLEFLPIEMQQAYWTADTALTFYAPERKFFIGAFANNLFNETIKSQAFPTPGTNIYATTLRPPRTYGLRAGVKF